MIVPIIKILFPKKIIKYQRTFPLTQIGRSYKSSPTSPTGQTPTD